MAFELLVLYMFMVEILDNMKEQNKESKDLIILLSRINNTDKCASGFFSFPVYTIFPHCFSDRVEVRVKRWYI